MKPLHFAAIALLSLMCTTCANADGNTGVNPIATIFTVNDSLSAAATLSLSLSLVGAAVFILGMLGHKKRADSTDSAARLSRLERGKSASRRWPSMSVDRAFRVARGERSRPIIG
jgi:hypothetical protein